MGSAQEEYYANLFLKARAEVQRLRIELDRLGPGIPIEPKDIKQFQRIESRNSGPFGRIEVIRRGVVTRIYEDRPGNFIFWSGPDYLGGNTYPGKAAYTYFLLEDAPEQPYPRKDAA